MDLVGYYMFVEGKDKFEFEAEIVGVSEGIPSPSSFPASLQTLCREAFPEWGESGKMASALRTSSHQWGDNTGEPVVLAEPDVSP